MGIQIKRAGWLTGGVLMAAVCAAAPAHAQDELWATVPFDFTVGKTVLPAGDYTIDEVSDPMLLAFHGRDGKTGMFVATIPDRDGQSPLTPELVFMRVGDTYRLEAVQMGDDLVRSVPLPRELRKAAADHVAVRLQPTRTRTN